MLQITGESAGMHRRAMTAAGLDLRVMHDFSNRVRAPFLCLNRCYMVVGDAERADRTMRALLRRMLELNDNQPYTYDRDGLIKLLDEEIESLQR